MTNDDKITSVKNYKSRVRPSKDALAHALDARRLEIELYWRRTAYFWTLIAAALAAFFLLLSADRHQQELLFIVACIGTTISLAWYLANRGSKYWQENWERHIDVLEQAGHDNEAPDSRLFKTTISQDLYSFWRLSRGYPYSLSRLNQVISLYMFSVWFALAAWRIFEVFETGHPTGLMWTMAVISLGCCIWLFLSKSSLQDREVDFKVSQLSEDGNNEAST